MSQFLRPKILLLGKNGMLGQAITEQFKVQSSKFKVVSWNRADLDITDEKQVIKKISELKPDIVINATGYTDVDGAESDIKTAFKINADGVGYIAEACRQIGASLIHFSTDYVFNGSQVQGYREDDIAHLKPVNVYGESKLKGEIEIKKLRNWEIRKLGGQFFIIRTSWLYGAGGRNFVDTMISRALDGQKIFKIVNDQFGLPTYTRDLAENVWQLVNRLDQMESGVYHCSNSISNLKSQPRTQKVFWAGSNLHLKSQNCLTQNRLNSDRVGISWYEFAGEIFKQAKKLKVISAIPKIEPCVSADFPRPARRPTYSVLRNTKLPKMREWRLALKDYLLEKHNYAKNI